MSLPDQNYDTNSNFVEIEVNELEFDLNPTNT